MKATLKDNHVSAAAYGNSRICNHDLKEYDQTNINYIVKLCTVFNYTRGAEIPPSVILENVKFRLINRRFEEDHWEDYEDGFLEWYKDEVREAPAEIDVNQPEEADEGPIIVQAGSKLVYPPNPGSMLEAPFLAPPGYEWKLTLHKK